GGAPSRQELLACHPDLADELQDFLAGQDDVEKMAAPLRAAVRGTVTVDGEILPRFDSLLDAKGSFFGGYEILEKIGRGGMGIVYRARQKNPSRLVALKILLGERSAAETQRFRNEAQTVAELDHPNIVPLYEVGEHNNQLYFTM